MSEPRRNQVRTIVSAVLGLALTAAAAMAGEPSQPFSRITLDLGTGGIEDTLPFDIPFYFSGTADATMKRFDVELIERAPRSGSATCAGGRRIASLPWVHREGAPLTFLVFQPRPLKAKQMYCLNVRIVRSLSDPALATFKAEGGLRVNRMFQQIGQVPEVSLDRAEELRQLLIQAIADPNTGDTLTVLSGSAFENIAGLSDVDKEAVKRRFQNVLRSVKQQQDLKYSEAQNLPGYITGGLLAFRRWGGSQTTFYAQFVARLEQLAQNDQAIAALLAPHRAALAELVGLEGSALGRAFNGDAPDGSSPPVAGAWDQTDIDNRAARVKATLSRVDEAFAVVNAFVAPLTAANLGTAAQLTAADRTDINTLVGSIGETQFFLQAIIASLTNVSTALATRQAAIARLMNDLGNDVVQNVSLVATTIGNFATRNAWYIGADLGFAVIPTIEETTPYIGTNIYFRPVNKDAPLTGETDSFMRRASAMVGITVASTLTKEHERDNLFGDRMLLIGGGLRINDSLRVAGGALLFKALDPDPFVNNPRIKFAWFFSGSIDWDVKGTFTSMTTKQPSSP